MADESESSRNDASWADRLSPDRRTFLKTGSVAAAALVSGGLGFAPDEAKAAAPAKPPPGKSPWGDETYKEPTNRPPSIRPGERTLPAKPRAYTDIKSYHAHIYFDEDTYEKAARIRKWVIERFEVELGNWNLEPRGPHVTPSFFFGFATELMPIVVPWLQLNSLGLTILIHPNTEDPRADHLHYALWVNRAQPVNAFGMQKPGPGEPAVEPVIPNIKPTMKPETG